MRSGKFSFIAVIVLCLLAVATRYKYPSSKPISWDVAGYYLYLPATFIYQDPGLSNYNKFDSLRIQYDLSSTFYQVYKTPKNRFMIKYTMGSALVYSPLFGVAHLRAKLTGQPADGFSYPYQHTFMWGMLIYVFLALILARKILLSFFDDTTSAITLFLIFLGTNLYYYLSLDNLQVHVVLFFLYTVFIWFTIRFHQKKSMVRSFLLGLVGGLIVITRPTDIVILTLPFLWSITSFSTFKTHLFSSIRHLPVFILAFCIAVSPLLFYWKYVTGSWLVNSYNNPGEGLDLFSPYTWQFLFSYRKGWFLYTPLAFIIILGIWRALKGRATWSLPVLIYFLFFIWIASSWTCWWYAASFGSRAMVQTYAIAILPLGFVISEIRKLDRIKGLILKSAIFLLVVFNLFQTWQFIHGILKPDKMTRAYYWKHFGSTHLYPGSDKLLLREKFLGTDTIPNPEEFFINHSFLIQWNDSAGQEEWVRNRLIKLNADSAWSLKLDSQNVFYTIVEQPYNKLTTKNFGYVRIEGWLRNDSGFVKNPVELVRTMDHQGKLYYYSSNLLTGSLPADSTGWQYFKLDYVFPDVRKPTDKFKGYFWLKGMATVYIRQLKVSIWEERNDPSAL